MIDPREALKNKIKESLGDEDGESFDQALIELESHELAIELNNPDFGSSEGYLAKSMKYMDLVLNKYKEIRREKFHKKHSEFYDKHPEHKKPPGKIQ